MGKYLEIFHPDQVGDKIEYTETMYDMWRDTVMIKILRAEPSTIFLVHNFVDVIFEQDLY